MTATVFTERRHSGGFMVSEANDQRSRDGVTILQQASNFQGSASPILPAGVILGATLDGTGATAAAQSVPAANVGNATVGTITLGQGVVEGVYTVQFNAATDYEVFAPNGELVGEGKTGVAFAEGGLGFTITAGGTPMAAGDGFTITMGTNANAGLYAPLSLTAADGTQTPAGILFNETDASQGNVLATVISRASEVNGGELIYPAGATAAQIVAINAQLQSIGIIVRGLAPTQISV